jgi:hypothetical protein
VFEIPLGNFTKSDFLLREKMKPVKLAQALLRRKELQGKVDQLHNIRKDATFELKVQRRQITDSVDDIRAEVPLLEASQVTAEYDSYSSKLRRVDAAIQQANWTAEVELDLDVMENYKDGSR